MERRTFLAMVPGSFLAAPLTAEAQQAGKVYRVGVLQRAFPNTPAVDTEAVRQGLRDHGYVEGQNIVIEYRMSSG